MRNMKRQDSEQAALKLECPECAHLTRQLAAMRVRAIEWRDAYWRLDELRGAYRRTYPDGSSVSYRLGMTVDDII